MQGFYAERDSNGRLIGKYADPQPGKAEEFVEGDEPLYIPMTWDDIRVKRSDLLTKSDWTQLPDADLTDAQKSQWADYRQALRDVPEDFDNPDDVIWPNKPQ